MYVSTKELPREILAVLKEVGFQKETIVIEAVETARPSVCCYEGNRAFVAFLDLNANRSEVHWGSWGGGNPYVKTVVDDGEGEIKLIPGSCVITGESGGRGNFARVFLHPDNVAKLLPKPSDVTEREAKILGVYKSIRSGYRDSYLTGLSVTPSDIDALVARGLLAKHGKGIKITANGKNAAAERYY